MRRDYSCSRIQEPSISPPRPQSFSVRTALHLALHLVCAASSIFFLPQSPVFSQGCAVFRHYYIIGGRLSELESGTAKYCCVARFTAKSRCGKTTRFRRIRSQLDEDGELVFPSLASAPHLLNVLAQAATSFLASFQATCNSPKSPNVAYTGFGGLLRQSQK